MHLGVDFIVSFSLSIQCSALQSETVDSSSSVSVPHVRVQQSAMCI